MRLFAAISPPDAVRDRLEGLQAGLPDEKRSPWENFHITLAFFGEVTAPTADELHNALATIRFEPFQVSLAGVDIFGGDKPRLAYAVVTESAALRSLQATVANAARGAGLPVDSKRFVPHVTLARFRRERLDERTRRWLEGATAFATPPFEVARFSLFQSTLGAGHPVYRELAAYTCSESA